MGYKKTIKAEGLSSLSFDGQGYLTGLATRPAYGGLAAALDRRTELKLRPADVQMIIVSMAQYPVYEPMFRAIVRAYEEMDAEQDPRFRPWRATARQSAFGPLYRKLRTALDYLFAPKTEETA